MTYLPLSETTIPQTPRRRISSPFPEHSSPPLLPLSPLLTPRNLPRCSVTHLFASVERKIARRDTFQGRNRAPRAMITIPPWNRPHFSRFIVILSTRPKEGGKDSIRDTVPRFLVAIRNIVTEYSRIERKVDDQSTIV